MEQIKLVNLVLSKKAGKDIVCGMSDKEKIIVGRNRDNDIVIPEDYSDVSRKHCIIYQSEGKITIEDNSRHGTYVNGEKIIKGKEYLLNNKDELKLAGICKLEIRIEEIEEEELKLEPKPGEDSGPGLEIDA